jgi:hypothetical protein
LIKTLMKVIREAITHVTTLPLKRNLIPRFMEGKSIRNNENALIVEKEGYQDSWKENFSVSHAAFSFCASVTEHSDDSDHVALMTQSPLSYSFIECSRWRRPLSSFTPMLIASIGVRFQDRTIFGTSRDDIPLDRSNGMGT